MYLGMTRKEWRNMGLGLLFISPWIAGFIWLMLYPIGYTLYLGFTKYSGFGDAVWIGLANYQRMFSDTLIATSLYNTLYYTFFAMLIGVPFTILMALAMNRPFQEVSAYRAALYLPSVLPLFALSFIVIWILNPRYGLLNFLLSLIGVPAINWLGDPTWARMAIVLMAQLGAGQVALIYLSGLRAIPASLYEAATIDGASSLQKFRSITLPLLTPVILYQSIIGIGLGLQVFTQAYIITDGGPNNATMFYVFYLYRNAFSYSQMGYASAMAWILFVISLFLAFVVFRWSRRWVIYDLV